MIAITLYSRPGCHLCDEMKEVVRRVADAHPGPHRLWVAPGADHVGAVLLPDYWPVVFGFLEAAGA